ncbi:hypothetical protein Salat_1529000 [Sesamum alatum]|uniref:Uncharacterized protein n=1 Tax=Sesamum alatum TaxID=300844 RepID=A0AAE1YC83_9LAMI|nr:hypothetical protein Salat_1529000 [Sesamum alatum]
MWYGGEGRNVPLAKYIGGNLQKFDYVNATHMNKATLDGLAGKYGGPQATSSSSQSRKRKHCIYEDPCRVELNVVESGENTQPPILPSVVEEGVAVDEEVEPSILTEPGPGPSQPSVQGPSMWTQLQMVHTSAPVQTVEMTLMPRLNIRAQPPMTRTGFMPYFTTRHALPVAKTIIKQHGKKNCGSLNFAKR